MNKDANVRLKVLIFRTTVGVVGIKRKYYILTSVNFVNAFEPALDFTPQGIQIER